MKYCLLQVVHDDGAVSYPILPGYHANLEVQHRLNPNLNLNSGC